MGTRSAETFCDGLGSETKKLPFVVLLKRKGNILKCEETRSVRNILAQSVRFSGKPINSFVPKFGLQKKSVISAVRVSNNGVVRVKSALYGDRKPSFFAPHT